MQKKFYSLSLIVSIVLFSCSRESQQLNDLQGSALSFNATVFEELQTRVIGSNWESGDKIGLFAIENGTILQEQSIVENYDNLSFSTTGNGMFKDDGQSVFYPIDGSAIDFISYYPYEPNLTSYSYPIDVTKQVDLMYSNNLKNASKVNTNSTLDFKRVLSKLAITIEPKGEGSLEGLTIELKGLKTIASFSLVNGEFTIDDTAAGELLLTPSGSDIKKEATCLLLPTSEKNSIEVIFKINENSIYKWKVPHALEGGKLYSYKIRLDGFASDVVPGTSYMELPFYTSGGDVPNTLTARHMVGNSSWLNGYSGPNNQRNYTILFDTENRVPLWVAYPLHSIHMRSGNRTNAWGYDPIIPIKYQADNSGWSNSTYNRGHMLASADRSATRELNRTTFYATNMVPQDVKMNGGVWNNLEQKMRDWAEQSQYDTLYVVTGSILAEEFTTDKKSGNRVAVPKYLYKALLRQEKSSKKWYSIAFKMDNKTNASSYQNSVVSVEELENETGFTFFPNLSDATEVKKQKSLTHWN